MIAEKDVLIPVNDGHRLAANVYRLDGAGRYPILMAMGIYGKDIHFSDSYKLQWDKLQQLNPGLCWDGSSGEYLRWEMIDPERWVPDGYVVIAVDSRGSGNSPGYPDSFSLREKQDFHDAIEWAAEQPWSTGKAALIGISYLSIKQWQVAAPRPPHLAAICPWEGGCDLYRDWSHHGGIFSNVFPTAWWPRQVLVNQHGNEDAHHRDRQARGRTTGPALNPAVLAGNCAEHPNDLLRHPLDDDWYGEKSADLGRIEVPLYSAGNRGGASLHLRGNIEGVARSGSHEKWLDLHVGTHFESFYHPSYVARQKRFFDQFLKGEDTGWLTEPKVRLEVRGPKSTSAGDESECPLARTEWQKYYRDCENRKMSPRLPGTGARLNFEARSHGITFLTAPFDVETEFTGTVTAHLWGASATAVLDLFATSQMCAPDETEVTFIGASDIEPLASGWLRASHRKLDESISLPYRPYHAHDEVQKLLPGEPYRIDVETWPTSMLFPKGYRLALTPAEQDYVSPGAAGRLLHDHEVDRRLAESNGVTTVFGGGSYLLLPFIPSEQNWKTR
jgi:uncharacterized protein